MEQTSYPEVNRILDYILSKLQRILGSKLIALYLDGSLVIGDFDSTQSDIDLVAAVSSKINEIKFNQLKVMHDTLIRDNPEWDDRIEVCYITTKALGNVKSITSEIINISPGEPIHRKESSKEWIMNWYLTREKGITLFGPPPTQIIEPLTRNDFIKSVRDHVSSWENWVNDISRNAYAQSYVRLSLCRALYSYKNGDQVSKIKAAKWALKELPAWSKIINEALIWREGPKHSPPDDAAFVETKMFVDYVRKLVLEA